MEPATARTGVDAVAAAALEIVAVHAVLGLDGFDGRTRLHLAPDRSRDATDLGRDPDPEPVRVVMAAVPLCRDGCGEPQRR